MDELDLLSTKMIPTDKLGSLTMMWTLIEYDYQRCFIAKSNNGNYYALNEIEDKPDKFGWEVTEIGFKAINSVSEGKESIQSLFRNKKNKYLLLFENNDDIGKVIKVDNFEGKYEIKGDLYTKDFVGLVSHKCLSCPHIKIGKAFTACYCSLIMTRINFKENVFNFCPLIYLAREELMAPSLDKECYCLLKDGRIVFVYTYNIYYNGKIAENEYHCYECNDKGERSNENLEFTIKHSDIVKVFTSKDELSKYRQANK